MLTNRDIARQVIEDELTSQTPNIGYTEARIRDLADTITEKIWQQQARSGPIAILLPIACPVCSELALLAPLYVTPHLVVDHHSSWLKMNTAEMPIVGHRCLMALPAGQQ